MGPTFALACAIFTAVLCAIFGYAPWVMIVAGVPWLIALGFTGKYGHRSFGTQANTDVTIVLVGLTITAAVVVPRFAEAQPCARARKAVTQIEDAQREWRSAHPGFATELSALSLTLDPSVSATLQTDEKGFVVSATHPGCVDETGALVPALGNSGP